jgi:villin 1/advillin
LHAAAAAAAAAEIVRSRASAREQLVLVGVHASDPALTAQRSPPSPPRSRRADPLRTQLSFLQTPHPKMAAFPPSAGQKAGLEIWRIENMHPVATPPANYGKFHKGDCYIVLKTTEKKGSREWDIFFWLGAESSQDEQGAAALHTINLDDQLGGAPVQHREVMGHESAKFLACFPQGVEYLDGGVASGFRKVERDKYETRLFSIKGKRNPRRLQMPVTADSLNDGDVFVLDVGLTIYVWNGKSANKYEKVKGADVAREINSNERGARAKVISIESGAETADFWTAIGGKKPIKSAEAGGDDDVKEAPVVLYRVSDASGRMETAEVGRKVGNEGLERKLLDTNDAFILDAGTEIFVWVGKGANAEERKKSMAYATQFLKDSGRPPVTPITKISENGEPAPFKSYFKMFDPPKVVDARAPKQEVVDVGAVFKKAQREAEEKMVDDATGQLEVYRVEDMKLAPVPKNMYGQFYMGDSYVLKYTYVKAGKPFYIIYFWQGNESSNDERGASALFAKKMDDDLNGEATQVRVVQGKEPNHFLALFKGKMVVHSGGKASGFKNRKDADSYDTDGVSLFHVRGTNAINTRAVQVAERASSLNSGDCFVLLTPDTMFVWMGAGANEHERQCAQNIAKILQFNRKLQVVNEGSEPGGFWDALGGKGEYTTTRTLQTGSFEPRLFQLNDHHGFKATEIFDFTQGDLVHEDVMLLDAYDEVFVWVGRDATPKEKEEASKLALEYVARVGDGRSPDTPIFRIADGREPPNFTCHFLGWNDAKPVDAMGRPAAAAAAAGGAKGAPAAAAAPERVTAANVANFADPSKNKFKLEQLQAGAPGGVDPSKKELYLSDDDFKKAFGCTLAEFQKMPAWKQADAKKKLKIF